MLGNTINMNDVSKKNVHCELRGGVDGTAETGNLRSKHARVARSNVVVGEINIGNFDKRKEAARIALTNCSLIVDASLSDEDLHEASLERK